MPYEITQRDGQWCVVVQGGGRTMGCHDNRRKAIRQLRAIKANESEGSDVSKEMVRCEVCGREYDDDHKREHDRKHHPRQSHFRRMGRTGAQ